MGNTVKKALLTSPVNPISNSAYSHRSAQAEIYAQMLCVGSEHEIVINYGNKIKDYSDYDLVYVYHGNDWGGTLNLFGGPAGLGDKEGLVELFKRDPKTVISVAIPMPDYPALLRKRLKAGEKFGNVLDQLPENIKDREYGHTPVSFEGTRKLVVGDSHAISLYRPGWEVLSIPFKTLHGALSYENGGLRGLIADTLGTHSGEFEEIEFYFGAIDIRHHLMRQPNPEAAAMDLAKRYYEEVEGRFPSAKVLKIYEPLPLENESRKLPKSGFYKGAPFYGSWEERNKIRDFFIRSIEQQCNANSHVEFVRWTDYLKNEKGELDFKHMEKPRSVHLARASYPFWNGYKSETQAVEATTSLENFFD